MSLRQCWRSKLPTAEELLAALATASSPSMAMKLVYGLEDRLTPEELQRLLPRLDTLAGFARKACDSSFILHELRRQAAQRFSREALGPDLVMYRGPGAPVQKALIVTLCGRSQRPNMAWSLFLQHLPSELFDVVIATDRNNAHFTGGVAGYAPDLLTLGQRLFRDSGADGYRNVYCYGTSSGGFPAVRLGLALDAGRAIAVGGVFPWPIFRLQQGEAFPAFDQICQCFSGKGRVLLLHASNDKDTREAVRAERALKARRIRITSTEDHNVGHHMYLTGRLRDFHSRLFEFGGKSFWR